MTMKMLRNSKNTSVCRGIREDVRYELDSDEIVKIMECCSLEETSHGLPEFIPGRKFVAEKNITN